VKIVLAVHHFPPTHVGGTEWEAFQAARGLQERGHAIRVLCVDPPAGRHAEGMPWRDETYESLKVRRLAFDPASYAAHPAWEYDNPWIGERLREYLEESRPDVFHLMGGYLLSGRALGVARALGIPSVVTLMDFWFLCPRLSLLRSDGRRSTVPPVARTCARCLGEERRRYRWAGRLVPWAMAAYWRWRTAPTERIERRTAFLRDSLAQAAAIVCRSEFVRSAFSASGVDTRRMVMIRQGCDFVDVPPRRLACADAPVLRVAYLGQIAWHKGVHVLFEAVRRMPDAQIAVRAYGDGDVHLAYAATLRRLAARDRRLELAGVRRGRRDVSRVYRESDVLVVPSLWYENGPNVILEAFAHGTPVIGADLGGIRELVRHETDGLLFDAGSPESLARQLRRLIDEPDLRRRLMGGVPRVRSVREELDDLEAVYRRVGGIGPPR
jgi:glycosyltransferase involved in cell wall biosynthesis